MVASGFLPSRNISTSMCKSRTRKLCVAATGIGSDGRYLLLHISFCQYNPNAIKLSPYISLLRVFRCTACRCWQHGQIYCSCNICISYLPVGHAAIKPPWMGLRRPASRAPENPTHLLNGIRGNSDPSAINSTATISLGGRAI